MSIILPEQEHVKSSINRVVKIFVASNGAVRPHFILTGPSGSGKSHMISSLAQEYGLNYLEINAAQLTKEGTSGNSLSKALSPLINSNGGLTLIFVDEFDKLFISGNHNSDLAHSITNGVQNEFLRVLESDKAAVFGDYGKYVDVPMNKTLFIFAGAFNGEEHISIDRLRDFGIKTEFLGRVGLVYNLEKLSVESMWIALQHSTLFETYLRLFPEVDKAQAQSVIMTAAAALHDKNTLGIRLLNTLINQFFINGGKLDAQQVEQTTFQTTLDFNIR